MARIQLAGRKTERPQLANTPRQPARRGYAMPSRLPLVLAIMVVATLQMLPLALAVPGAPEPPARFSGNRFLFVISSASNMSRCRDKATAELAGFIRHGLEGWLNPGDTYGVWSYATQVDTRFPMQVWTPSAAPELAEKMAAYLKSVNWRGKEDPGAFMPALQRVIESVGDVTILIVNDGSEPLLGTPFDHLINQARSQVYPESKELGLPVITTLTVRNGQIEKWGVSSPELRLPLPHPSASIAARLAGDESLPLKAAPSESQSTGLTNTPSSTAISQEKTEAHPSNHPAATAASPPEDLVTPSVQSARPTAAPPQRSPIIITRENQPSKSWMDLPPQSLPPAIPALKASGAAIETNESTPSLAVSNQPQVGTIASTNASPSGPKATLDNITVHPSTSSIPLVKPEELAPASDPVAGEHPIAARRSNDTSPQAAASHAVASSLVTRASTDITAPVRPSSLRAVVPGWGLFALGCLIGALSVITLLIYARRSRPQPSLITASYGLAQYQMESKPRPQERARASDPQEGIGPVLKKSVALDGNVDSHHATQQV